MTDDEALTILRQAVAAPEYTAFTRHGLLAEPTNGPLALAHLVLRLWEERDGQ